MGPRKINPATRRRGDGVCTLDVVPADILRQERGRRTETTFLRTNGSRTEEPIGSPTLLRNSDVSTSRGRISTPTPIWPPSSLGSNLSVQFAIFSAQKRRATRETVVCLAATLMPYVGDSAQFFDSNTATSRDRVQGHSCLGRTIQNVEPFDCPVGFSFA